MPQAGHQRGRWSWRTPDPGSSRRVHHPRGDWNGESSYGKTCRINVLPAHSSFKCCEFFISVVSRSLFVSFSLFGTKVTMVGDLKNGRTVHSLAKLLCLYNVTLRYVSPAALCMPDSVKEYVGQKGIHQVSCRLKEC